MAVVKMWESLDINVGASWSCKLKLQGEVASCRLQCPLKTIIQIEDSSIPMQVKFAVKKGYNYDSIVRSLIAKETNCNLNRNAKKLNYSKILGVLLLLLLKEVGNASLGESD